MPLLYKTIELDYRASMTVFHSKSERIVHTHKELRTALRDTEKYSSDLQGDADVRDYRQIPLEVDPPRSLSLTASATFCKANDRSARQ